MTPLLTTATSSSPSVPPPRVKKQQEEQEEVDNLLKEVGFEPTALWLFSPRICLWKKNTTRHWKERGRINCCVAFTKCKLWKKEPFESQENIETVVRKQQVSKSKRKMSKLSFSQISWGLGCNFDTKLIVLHGYTLIGFCCVHVKTISAISATCNL